jgi:hypothetical protein
MLLELVQRENASFRALCDVMMLHGCLATGHERSAHASKYSRSNLENRFQSKLSKFVFSSTQIAFDIFFILVIDIWHSNDK